MTSVPVRRRKFRHRIPCDDLISRAEIAVLYQQAKEYKNCQKLGERHGADSPSRPQKGLTLLIPSLQASGLQNSEPINFCSVKLPNLWPFIMVGLGERNGTPLQYSCLENPMDGGTWWAAVHGVVKSRTRLSEFTFIFHFHALEKEMATHSRVLAWRIPGTVEPGGMPSMGSHRVRHD